jgi:hypothetical protein
MTIEFPLSAAQNQFTVYDECLIIGDILLTRLVQRVGRTVVVPDRYSVAEAGICVNYIDEGKNSEERSYLIAERGLQRHPAAWGNFGRVIRENYSVVIGYKVSGKKMEAGSVAGITRYFNLKTSVDRYPR